MFGRVKLKETKLERDDFTLLLLMLVGKGESAVDNFLSFHFLSAVVPAILSKDRLRAFRP